MGSGGPNFLNAALLVSTRLEDFALREQVLHPLEASLGFDPDHFLPEQVAARPRHAYYPFGAGQCIC